MHRHMLKSNQIDAKFIFIADTKIKFVENPVYFNISFFDLFSFSSPRNKLVFCCKVVFLVQIFVLIVDDCTAER